MRTSMRRPALAIALFASTLSLPLYAQPKPDPAKIEQAKKHMAAGAAFYNDPSGHKCEEAIREFGKAYELSGSLNALKGMAICNLELERDGDAIDQYTRYIQGKGSQIDPSEKQQIETDLAALKAAVATVTLKANKPNVKITDVRTPSRGYPISNTYTIGNGPLKLGIHPGQHVFTASVEGMPDVSWKVEITNGGTYERTFEIKPAEVKPIVPIVLPKEEPVQMIRPTPTAVWVMTGLTGALLVPTVVFMVRAKSQNDEFKSKNGVAPVDELNDLRSSVKNSNLLADVFMGATIASGAATLIIYLVRPTKPAPKKTGFSLAPSFTPNGGGAWATGTF